MPASPGLDKAGHDTESRDSTPCCDSILTVHLAKAYRLAIGARTSQHPASSPPFGPVGSQQIPPLHTHGPGAGRPAN